MCGSLPLIYQARESDASGKRQLRVGMRADDQPGATRGTGRSARGKCQIKHPVALVSVGMVRQLRRLRSPALEIGKSSTSACGGAESVKQVMSDGQRLNWVDVGSRGSYMVLGTCM